MQTIMHDDLGLQVYRNFVFLRNNFETFSQGCDNIIGCMYTGLGEHKFRTPGFFDLYRQACD